MGLFKRFFRLAKSEAHATIDRLEDPVKMTEQGIRDLKTDLQNSIRALAEAKAVCIRIKKEAEEKKQLSADYERKAILLLKKAESGELAAAEADNLASQALQKKDAALVQATSTTNSLQKQEQMIGQLESNIRKLRSQISEWEGELKILKSRAKVATATKKLNQQMAKVDSSSTISLLERMKEKVDEEESLAQSYGEIAQLESSIDSEIEKALSSGSPPQSASTSQNESLAQLKAKLGMKPE